MAGLLLAAGASRRLGAPKQLLCTADGVPLVALAAKRLLDAGCSPVIVVTGASAAEVMDALTGLSVELVHNAEFARGMGSSIACGIKSLAIDLREAAIEGVLIAACDMPSADAAHLRALISASENGTKRTASAYMALHSSDSASMMRGIPAVLPKRDWEWLSALDGDRGAKPLLQEAETLSVRLFRGMFDIDTPADLAAWRVGFSPTPTSSPELPMPGIAQMALADLEHEVANTRKMLERLPEGHLDFTPHTKSWPLGKLANHLCDFPWWGTVTLQTTEIDFSKPFPRADVPTTTAGFLALFDARMTEFRAALAQSTDAQMMETWTIRNGEQVLMAMPRVGMLRGMVISHMIHHRAQMTIYFRLLDVPLPGLYGPSADEQ